MVIDKVLPGSPAELAGLKAGDAFVSLDDFPVTEQGDVILVIGGKKPGDGVAVKVRRAGRGDAFLAAAGRPVIASGEAVVKTCPACMRSTAQQPHREFV